MQHRHEWYPVNIPLEGGNGWVAQTTGTPDFSEINHITIDTQSGGSQTLEMWIDGMKTISKDALPAYGANIAADGKGSRFLFRRWFPRLESTSRST